MQKIFGTSFFLSMALVLPGFALATDFTSSNFILKDPIIPPASGYSTSTNFRLTGSISQIGIGTSTASNFRVSSGFLYFPVVTAPTLTATAGDGQVSLSWTVSAGVLGWNVSGYNAGRSTTSGGPYTFTFMGSTTSGTITGLTNGTTHYFIVRPEDAFSNSLATSSEVSATPVASAAPPPAPATPHSSGPLGPIFELIRRLIEIAPPRLPEGCVPVVPQDLNCDGKVDLQDLSVFLFLSPEPSPNPADFNKDEMIDLQDLSFLFFGWTERLLTFVSEEPRRSLEEVPAFAVGEKPEQDLAAAGEAAEELLAPRIPGERRGITGGTAALWVIILLLLIIIFIIYRFRNDKGGIFKEISLESRVSPVPVFMDRKRQDLEDRIMRFARRVSEYAEALPQTFRHAELRQELIRSVNRMGIRYIEIEEAESRGASETRFRMCREDLRKIRYWLQLTEPEEKDFVEKEALILESDELIAIFNKFV